MSQVCLAPVGPDAWPSEGLLSPEVALRTTVGPPRHGTAPAAGRATSGVVVNGRPRRLVLIQVRAALAHLRLLGGALNLGPVVEVRSDIGSHFFGNAHGAHGYPGNFGLYVRQLNKLKQNTNIGL